MRRGRMLLTVILTGLGLGVMGMVGWAEDPAPAQQRAAWEKTFTDGNYKDAYEGFRKLALDPGDDPRLVGHDMDMAIQSLRNLGDLDQVDAFREEVIGVHGQNWRLLQSAAESYLNVEHYGFIVAGKFERGNKRGGGQVMNATARDRGRAMQLMVQAMPLVNQDEDHAGAADFYLSLARILLNNAGYSEAWRLQALTNLAELPDYDEGWYFSRGDVGAPVGPDGNPIYYQASKTFEDAASDGERWRWALNQALEMSAQKLNAVRWELAMFCQSQFGEQTMAYYGYWFGRGPASDDDKDESGTYALNTLAEDETIARLATGIKRFKLPDEFNYLKILQKISDEPQTGYGPESLDGLAQIFENRRQYVRASEVWRRAIKEYGPGSDNYRQRRLEQIVGNWGRFENATVQVAAKGATIEFRFRNGKEVHFEAHQIRVGKLLDDVKAYLKSNPPQLDWEKLNIGDLGYRLVQKNQQEYLEDKQAAKWDLELEPREAHFDKRITVTTPLQKAGAYLVTARMEDGNTSQIVVWLSDTVIVKKPLAGKTYCYVADAATGKPIPKANVEFFGYRQRQVGNTNRYTVDTTNFAEFTDADGQVMVGSQDEQNQYQWVITARTNKGRFAHLGFTNIWNAQYYDQEYEATKVFTITDRPVYRPKQTVKFKFWVRHAKYDQEEESSFANQSFMVEIHNPQGEKVLEKQYQADAYGGFDGEYELPVDAQLGMYQIFVVNQGGGSFRVEEYKKPEYEVTVTAPTEPVMLGEKITASIEAKYFFGAPVTQAKVKYKVLRTSYSERWYPLAPWDWFYGRGYWWFGYDAAWYPGWKEWGCMRPIPWWWGQGYQPPEEVANVEVPIGADGKVSVEIDTSVAKELHPDEDHQYQLVAEVVDESRRTIVGQGTVKVARKPFKVFAWVDRGYYRVGDAVRAHFDAHTLNDKPVEGQGKLTLYRVTYAKNEPVEREVRSWDLDTNAQGTATQQLKASAAGQYRLSYKLTDAQGHEIEGAYLFTVMGEGFDGADFRFNHIELIPDKREYQSGEKVQLQINTDRVGSTVLLFVRPANGVYLPPQVVRLEGKSTLAEIEVTKKDMPNFFVEAVTIASGQLFSETKEIVVPPEKRILNVAVEPSSREYKPGEPAEVKVTLTDFFGKPFVGSTVMAIYDKSVEYISGGSNVPEIKDFFWKWRRSHYPQTESNLSWYFYNLVKSGDLAMGDLGVFGGSVADELSEEAAPASGNDKAATGAVEKGRMAPMASTAAPGRPGNAMMAEGKQMANLAGQPGGPAPDGGGGADLVQPTVRSNFADTALWAGSLTTDGDGTATVKLDMPENLTTWKVKCWGLGHGTKVGEGEVEVITRKNLILRLQAPRFFVQKDEVVLSANVHNYLAEAKQVQVVLELEGPTLEPLGDLVQTVQIAAGAEQRVDWRVKVVQEGEALLRMKALTSEESDAMEMRFPVFVHGMLKMESVAGALRPEDEAGKFEIRIPEERRAEQSRLEVRYSPSLAGAMVDALPYLVDYPYGCTEQTLNRFLPTVITQKILLEMQLDLKAIRDKRTNLNAQEIGDDAERAKGWKRFDHNPVFDEAEVVKMVKEGVQRLTDMQLSDGGWGWFSGWGEHSWAHTTAYVVHGLQLAQRNDVALVPGMLERGVAWLTNYQAEQIRLLKNGETKTQPYKLKADDLDAFVYMVLVDAEVKQQEMQDYLYRDRTDLSVYSKAMFGLALEKQQVADRLAMILKNISQFLIQDEENQTAYLKLPETNYWWYWYGSEVEADSYYLKLLSRTNPKGEIASRLVKYLLNNRKHATYWDSTRDTSVAIEALAEYWKASGETQPEMTVEVWVDGKQQKAVEITSANLFTYDNKLVLEGEALTSGMHTVELKKHGRGPLYYNGYTTNFTLEDHITRAGLEIKVNRKYYKLVKVDKKVKVAGSRGQALDQKVEKYRREEIPNLGTLKSSDLVEVELEIDSKNDYEYLLFEDMKAAGFEPVDQRSGYNSNSLGAYMELRDNRVCFFVRALARGKHSVSYRLRAEIPGKFSALPTRASAMYAPELKGNSDEIKIVIED